ncbi:hypothetical protein NIIDNTM18_39770 [Mycolicibacterium litorale]|uniref:MmyB-like transcription regulator ligand binding domain-containing protein n=1 Tax=Mycolicibacterium litorale TaxID=758802 RepID=A0A6S6P8H5_9MYCO|nr:hypothetical protein NIIDNTM18_39770 [Mycolicibacterium litorale]
MSLWRGHRVKPCEADSYQLRHPLVGPVTVTRYDLTVARSADQSVPDDRGGGFGLGRHAGTAGRHTAQCRRPGFR